MANGKKPLPRITLRNLRPPYDEKDGDYVYFVDADGQLAAERNPFLAGAREFELVNAWWLCEAATLVYSDPRIIEETFRQKTPLQQFRAFSSGGGTECFVVSNEEFALVAFRGTEASTREGSSHDFRDIFRDIRTDADIRMSDDAEGGKVHRGFADGVRGVWEEGGLGEYVANLTSSKIWFTGHSLGAALATLAAARSPRLDGLYTFGSPRVGDAVFAASLKRRMSGGGLKYYRVVNGEDVVTTVPMFSSPPIVAFEHAGTLRHIDRAGRISEDPTMFERLKDAVHGLLPFDGEGDFDNRFFNLIPNALDDHVPTRYATHLWNAHVAAQGGGG